MSIQYDDLCSYFEDATKPTFPEVVQLLEAHGHTIVGMPCQVHGSILYKLEADESTQDTRHTQKVLVDVTQQSEQVTCTPDVAVGFQPLPNKASRKRKGFVEREKKRKVQKTLVDEYMTGQDKGEDLKKEKEDFFEEWKRKENEEFEEKTEAERANENLKCKIKAKKQNGENRGDRENKDGLRDGYNEEIGCTDWGLIGTIPELLKAECLHNVESRLSVKTSKSEPTVRLPISGRLLYQWAGPPECMSMLVLQDAMRLGNSNPQLSELRRLHNLARDAQTEGPTKSFRTSFSKVHPNVKSLATALQQCGSKAIPKDLKVEVPGTSQAEQRGNVDKTIVLVSQAVEALKKTEFDRLSHGGSAIVQEAWKLLKDILENSLT